MQQFPARITANPKLSSAGRFFHQCSVHNLQFWQSEIEMIKHVYHNWVFLEGTVGAASFTTIASAANTIAASATAGKSIPASTTITGGGAGAGIVIVVQQQCQSKLHSLHRNHFCNCWHNNFVFRDKSCFRPDASDSLGLKLDLWWVQETPEPENQRARVRTRIRTDT